MIRYDLVDKIDETGCCDRLFGQVVVTGYFYRFLTGYLWLGVNWTYAWDQWTYLDLLLIQLH